MECKIWKLNSQTGDKTKYNTIIINNSTHDTGIQLTGCIVFQQKAQGGFLRPCAFILPHPPFSAVSAVILCRSGNPPGKPALKNQHEIFPKSSHRQPVATHFASVLSVSSSKSLFKISPRTSWRWIFRPDFVKNPCNPSGLLRLFASPGKKSAHQAAHVEILNRL